MSNIFVNTNASATASVAMAAVASQVVYRRLDLPLILNGALAGLVSITTDPVSPTPVMAMVIGAVGALIMMGACWLLERFHLDDVVGAIPVHLAAGIWGTLVGALTNPAADIMVQALGIVSTGAFVAVTTVAVWLALRVSTGIRLQRRQEMADGDITEAGMRAYNLS